jgi:hypothetical protein
VSCPYGQTAEDIAAGAPRCFVPGSHGTVAVTEPIAPQVEERRARDTVICTCRCAGPGPGPFCRCPDSLECAHVIDDLKLSDPDLTAGSYCIPGGTTYDPNATFTDCDRTTLSCGDANPFP